MNLIKKITFLIMAIAFLLQGCESSRDYGNLPDETPESIIEVQLTIALWSKFDESYTKELSEISLPFRSNNCLTTAFASKIVKLIRLDTDSHVKTEINTWEAGGWNVISDRLRGETFESIAKNVEDNFNNFKANEHLISEPTKKLSVNDIIAFIKKDSKSKFFLYADSEANYDALNGLVTVYSTIEELRTGIADYLCESKKEKSVLISVLFKPVITNDSTSIPYINQIKSIKDTLSKLPQDYKKFNKAEYDDLIAKCNELLKIADSFIAIIDKGEKDNRKKDLENGLAKLQEKIQEIKNRIKTPPPIGGGKGGKEKQPPGGGTFYLPGGDRYDGYIKDGKLHGFGVYYFKTGKEIWNDPQHRFAEAGYTLKGSWNDGKFTGGKLYNRNNILVTTIIIGQ